MVLNKQQAIRKIRNSLGDHDESPDMAGYRFSAAVADLIYQLADAGIIQVKLDDADGPPEIKVRANISPGPPSFPGSPDPVFIEPRNLNP